MYYVCAGYIPWTGSPCFLSVIVRLRRNRRNTFILIVYIVDYIVVELRVRTFSSQLCNHFLVPPIGSFLGLVQRRVVEEPLFVS